MTPLLQVAAWSAVMTMAVLVASRVWRRDDPAVWHAAWAAVAVGSLGALVVALASPGVSVLVVTERPTVERAMAIVSGDRTAGAIALVYGLGAGVLACRLIAGILLVGRLRRRSVAIDLGTEALAPVRALVAAGRAELRAHPRVQVPVTMGWRSPVVLLPDHWRYWESARLAAVIRHELAHVASRDYLWNVVGAVFQVAFWFSPFAWIVVRRQRLCAELAADRAAAAGMGSAPYARVLIESARELIRAESPGVLAPGAATALEARVAALVHLTDDPPHPSRWSRRAAAGIVVAALLVAGAVRVAAVRPEAVSGGHEAIHLFRHPH